MHSAGSWLAIVLGGAVLGACGSSSSSGSGNNGTGDGGAGTSESDAGTGNSSSSGSSSGGLSSGSGSSSGSSSSGSSSSGSSSSGSSSSGSSSSGSSSSGGSSSGSAGYAIPLSAPEGPDLEYTAQVTVGNQTFAMQIDTGSTTAAVAGTACTTCTKVTPLYTVSSTAKATGQTGSSKYADGSGWSGPIYTDTVTLANGSPSISLELVEMTKATGQFFSGDNDYQGIIGLGPSGNEIKNTTGYIPVVTGAGVSNIFAFAFCDATGANAGTMWLGGDGSPAGAVVYTPMVAISGNNQFYAINVNGMSLGGTSIVASASATFAQPVLDTGTSLFYVPTSVFTAFETALEASSGFKTVFGTNTFTTDSSGDVCVTDATATDALVELTLPSISLALPNATSGQADVTIEAKALDTYLYSGGSGQYCLALADGGTQDASTFGDAFLQAFLTIIDVAGGRVGFAPTSCVAPAIRRVRHPAMVGPHRPPRPVRH